jgi:AsmA protein
MRALKIAGIVAGSIIALVVGVLLLVVLFVDPNDYRDDIERVVESKTGRQLTLGGDLRLSIFPWLALEAGPASLGDAPGFGDEPFVSIQEARVGVRLLPLIRGKIEVGDVRLAGARIRLITDERGRDNWADLGEQEATEPAPAGAAPMEVPTLAGLEIEDASVTLENRQEKTRRVVRDFNLKTGRLASAEPFDLSTAFVLDEEPSLSAKVRVSTTVTADLEANSHQLAKPEIEITLTGPGYPQEGIPVRVRANSLLADVGKELYRLDALDVKTTWKGEGFPAAGVPVTLQAKYFNANLAAQTLELAGLALDVAGAQVSGELTGKEILDAPVLNGPLKLAQVSLREWAPKLGVELPATADPKVFDQLSFSGTVAMTQSSAEVGDIVLLLDDTTAKGTLGIADLDAKALRFDLHVDRINADRYLPPTEKSEKPANAAADAAPTPIPVDMLRTLNARGQLQVGEAIFAGIKFTKLRLGVNARDGKVRFNPSEASLYGGNYSGDIGIDATGDVARVSLDEHVTGVDFAPLFKDFFETERVSGKGTANLKLTGAGRTTDDIVKTLSGNLDFKVADGALEGADLWYEIRRARAVLKQQAVPERSGPVRTPFTALTGTGVMKNGVLSNNDLNVAMQYLKVTGQGTVDVPASTLDYRLLTTVMKIPRAGADAAQAQDLVDAEIPVKVTGSLTDPKIRPDLEGYLKHQLKQRVDEEKGKVEDQLKEKLNDKLKDIFRR